MGKMKDDKVEEGQVWKSDRKFGGDTFRVGRSLPIGGGFYQVQNVVTGHITRIRARTLRRKFHLEVGHE